MSKKIFITLWIIYISVQFNHSQEVSFPIYYSLSLFKQDTMSYIDPNFGYNESFLNKYKRRNSNTIVHTKLDSVLLVKLYANFVQHIEANKKVRSYSMAQYDIGLKALAAWNIADLNDANLYQSFNNYYLSLEGDDFEWKDGGANGNGWTHITATGNFLSSSDTTKIQYPYPPYNYHDTVFNAYKGPDLTEGLTFTEIWNFNSASGCFSKKIEFLALKLFSRSKGSLGIPIFCFKAQSTVNSTTFKENMKYDIFFDLWNSCDPYAEEFSCYDVPYELSASTNTREYISTENRTELILHIFNAVEAGTLIPLDAKSFEKGKEKSLTTDKMYESMTSKEKVSIQDPFPPYDMKDTIVTRIEEFSNVVGIRFIEDWNFEPKELNIYKKVKTFALLFAQYDKNTGELTSYKPYFYLKPKN